VFDFQPPRTFVGAPHYKHHGAVARHEHAPSVRRLPWNAVPTLIPKPPLLPPLVHPSLTPRTQSPPPLAPPRPPLPLPRLLPCPRASTSCSRCARAPTGR
jgi:hypothetical protein